MSWPVFDLPPVLAYIGPGAGFAFVSSFFAILFAFLLALAKLVTSPFRALVRALRFSRALSRARVKRVVIVGLDGQDPELTDRYLSEGLLPNFAKLRDQGCYVRLDTSFPAESPVAWSSFQTGCNPGRHRVFDFLVPSRTSYLPELCSAKVTAPARSLKVGRLRLPLGSPAIDLGRKSRSFWSILGDHGIFSTVIRVPITFPPEKFRGAMLGAMCVPDLKGSQGTFSYYSSDPADHAPFTGGVRFAVEVRDGVVQSHIAGPDNTFVDGAPELRLPFTVRLGENGAPATIEIDGERHALPLRAYTPWIGLKFKALPGLGIRGICRFYLKQVEPTFKLYMTPVNIDPDKPALPISHPFTYAVYLAKTQGRFATLGLAEDTWALNERVLDEQAFLEQAWSIHDERERMLFDAIEKTRRGAVVTVFDITDRLQHMFFRYLDPQHPANAGKDVERHREAIRELYTRMDGLIGRVMEKIDDDTVLMVMSDHGFKPFRRGVNLNTWLWQNGYLVLQNGRTGAPWYRDVDWTKTRAYAVGLGGIYLNLVGRRARGIVPTGDEERRLRAELREKLCGLQDPAHGTRAVGEAYDLKQLYRGPYVDDAPDLLVGFRPGWRVSWTCATGVIDEEIFEDNTKSWSGDHCMNPPDVPGIFFCNRRVSSERIDIMDVGPTVLDLFGVPVPPHCDGKPRMTAP